MPPSASAAAKAEAERPPSASPAAEAAGPPFRLSVSAEPQCPLQRLPHPQPPNPNPPICLLQPLLQPKTRGVPPSRICLSPSAPPFSIGPQPPAEPRGAPFRICLAASVPPSGALHSQKTGQCPFQRRPAETAVPPFRSATPKNPPVPLSASAAAETAVPPLKRPPTPKSRVPFLQGSAAAEVALFPSRSQSLSAPSALPQPKPGQGPSFTRLPTPKAAVPPQLAKPKPRSASFSVGPRGRNRISSPRSATAEAHFPFLQRLPQPILQSLLQRLPKASVPLQVATAKNRSAFSQRCHTRTRRAPFTRQKPKPRVPPSGAPTAKPQSLLQRLPAAKPHAPPSPVCAPKPQIASLHLPTLVPPSAFCRSSRASFSVSTAAPEAAVPPSFSPKPKNPQYPLSASATAETQCLLQVCRTQKGPSASFSISKTPHPPSPSAESLQCPLFRSPTAHRSRSASFSVSRSRSRMPFQQKLQSAKHVSPKIDFEGLSCHLGCGGVCAYSRAVGLGAPNAIFPLIHVLRHRTRFPRMKRKRT
ncbi:vegetative cell wall protein gp1-like [Penaeus monodon]|uniref:vegetative cell wall protein gp1-like n=1 Tax=Penaeus monodon TaxID=6687 RepID=UPI0018A71A62|nr:vegetative cell wall protein gp1-like [Penaeus monodon]